MWLSIYAPDVSVIDSTTDILPTMPNTLNIEGSLANNSSASGESSAQYISQPPRCRPTSSTDQTENGLRKDLPEQQASVCSSACLEPGLYELIGCKHSAWHMPTSTPAAWQAPGNGKQPQQSVAARHGVRSVECVLGALPVMHPSLSSSDCAAQASVALHGEAARKLQWSRLYCDHACGPWRSFLLLMTEGVAMHEGEVLFPNQIWHRGRTVHNVTEHGLLYLLSDPLLSEVGLQLAPVSMIQRHCQSLDLSTTSET
jgi:hypothetical protein